MIDKILAYVEKWHMLEEGDHIIAGVSGGADSVCLLYVLMVLRRKLEPILSFSITVVHVHHGLRGNAADEDEAYVKKLCESNNLPFATYHYNVELIAKKRKQSTEEAGRFVRKEAFDKAKEQYGGTKIAVAHHKDDNAETLLLNLARGTGLRGLGGIRPVREELIRPLLCVGREEIEAYLKEQAVPFCTDATNAENRYTRNKIRNCVLHYLKTEVNAKTVEHMNDTMEQMQKLEIYMQQQTEVCYAECVKPFENGLLLCKKDFCRQPSVLQEMLIRRCLSEVSGKERDITKRHIEDVSQLFEKQTGRRISLPYQMSAGRTYEGVCLKQGQEPKEEETPESVRLQIPGVTAVDTGMKIRCRILDMGKLETVPQKTYTKWFDYDIIKGGLVLRTRKAGDYFTIDKEGRRQKLKSFYINQKILEQERDHIALIAEGGHILWIIGGRVSAAYQVSSSTTHILEIQIYGGENRWQRRSEY